MGGRGQQITDISFSSDLPNSAKDSSYQKLVAQESGFVILKLKGASQPVTKLSISIVQYLNTAPLVWGFTNGPLCGKYDLSFTVPSQCAEQLRAGQADVAIIPAIEYQRIDDLVILPDMAIASKKQVRSLLIIAKKPIEQVKTFALDGSSRSTQTLTRILCAEKWKIAPEFFEAPPDLGAMLQQADAALLIGDPALRIAVGIERDRRPGAEGQTLCQAATLGIANSELLYVYDVVGEYCHSRSDRRFPRLPGFRSVAHPGNLLRRRARAGIARAHARIVLAPKH